MDHQYEWIPEGLLRWYEPDATLQDIWIMHLLTDTVFCAYDPKMNWDDERYTSEYNAFVG